MERLLGDEQLDEINVETIDKALAAIEAGDKEGAKKLVEKMRREWLTMHDMLVEWITGVLTSVGKDGGDALLEKTLRESFRQWVGTCEGLPTAKQMQIVAKSYKYHGRPMRLEEDDEKFTIVLNPCPSGGHLLRKGAYEPAGRFLRVAGPQPMTYSRGSFPVYCAHCAMEEVMAAELGVQSLLADPSSPSEDGTCLKYWYKDRKKHDEAAAEIARRRGA